MEKFGKAAVSAGSEGCKRCPEVREDDASSSELKSNML